MPSGSASDATSRFSALLLLPVAACLAILPLILHGNSCGQDLTFHVQSWMDAAQQLRHGHYPHWDFSAAWNAGEPRFVFYPPLSWLLGAMLTLILPIGAAPIAFIFLALLASGLSFHRLASDFVSPNAALIASAIYLANPYMLFNAFERSALAELLAAAWVPLLLLALFRRRPTVRGIAIPLALLWLTNAPAAVMGSYLLAVLAIFRVAYALLKRNPQALGVAITCIGGTLLGLALPAFYLIPAAYERRFIQVAMAIIPNLRYQDNFLFTHTADAAHNAVNHTASTLALTLLLLTTAVLALLLAAPNSGLPAGHRERTESRGGSGETSVFVPRFYTAQLLILTLLIAFLLTPLSTPIWQILPELPFLQFPWRLLTLLSPILALAIALLLDRFALTRTGADTPALARSRRATSGIATLFLAALLPLVLGLCAFRRYAQVCDPAGTPANLAHLLATHHGTLPTDEYTPTNADNDLLRTDNPGFWLAPLSHPNAPAPDTTPTATDLNPSIDTDDTPMPVAQTVSARAPQHLTVHLDRAAILVLNLRDYPSWRVTNLRTPNLPAHLHRKDGLLAIPLPSGPSTIDVAWRATRDQHLGDAISVIGLLLLLRLSFRRRQSATKLPPSAQDRVESH